ncbi:MAG: hypothetical protein KGJ89_00560 [Patescibacteria group bacterium]|nr:hypothetical protein [Patescibacteria group bacterium]MDE2015006.1 hypothetical protein [Patescibacteria group bacterium]MDE2226434.1 hypothetical protein [Patescibacteria group bacterium]
MFSGIGRNPKRATNERIGLAISLIFAIIVAVIASKRTKKITEQNSELHLGQQLTDAYCRGCHTFNHEPIGGMRHVNTLKTSDETLLWQIGNDPSNTSPNRKDDQVAIFKFLRYQEKHPTQAQK